MEKEQENPSKTAPSVKELIKDIYSRIGHDGIIDHIEQLYECFLADADRGEQVYSNHWTNYRFITELKAVFNQARDEFDLKH